MRKLIWIYYFGFHLCSCYQSLEYGDVRLVKSMKQKHSSWEAAHHYSPSRTAIPSSEFRRGMRLRIPMHVKTQGFGRTDGTFSAPSNGYKQRVAELWEFCSWRCSSYKLGSGPERSCRSPGPTIVCRSVDPANQSAVFCQTRSSCCKGERTCVLDLTRESGLVHHRSNQDYLIAPSVV
jgi:hypothetical protein